MRPLILASVVVGLIVAPLTAIAQTTPTTTVVTVVNPQGSGNTTSTATSVMAQPVAVTVAVTASSGGVAPSGSVSIYSKGSAVNPPCTAMLGSPVGTTATATCTLTPLPGPTSPGFPYVIFATYGGGGVFAASSSSGAGNGALSVNVGATITTITAHTPDPSAVNTPVAVSWTVVAAPPAFATPNPATQVFVSDGSASCLAAVSAGGCALTPITVGVKTLTAQYLGDLNLAASTSAGVSHTVVGGGTTPTTTVVTVVNPQGSGNTTSTATSVMAQPVAVTVAVTASSGGVAPSGSVSIYSKGSAVNPPCTAMLGSPVGTTATATCTLTPLPGPTSPGFPYVIFATYGGGGVFAASSSSGAGNGALSVNVGATITTITAHTPDPSAVNTPVAVSWTVVAAPPAFATPNPATQVFVSDGSASCLAAVSAGGCALTPITVGV